MPPYFAVAVFERRIPGVSGCLIDGDRPPAARPSGGRPGLSQGETDIQTQGATGERSLWKGIGWYPGTSQGEAVIVRRGLRAPSARSARDQAKRLPAK
jgi:hypothetical protein